jgi:hypothetical protein
MTKATGSAPSKSFALNCIAETLAREVAVPAVEHHAIEQDALLALAVRLDVQRERREFVLRHRRESRGQRVLLK